MNKIRSNRTNRLSLSRFGLIAALVIGFAAAWTAGPATSAAEEVTMFKNKGCQCCTKWANQLRAKGYKVTETGLPNMNAIKKRYQVAEKFQGCHTAIIGGYVIEGHVPLKEIERLLRERPDAKGLSVAGMPLGSPGMEVPGQKADSYTVMLMKKDGTAEPYAKY